MKRKVIQLAKKTLVVSLPIKWAKKNDINKGDELDLIEEKASLVIGKTKRSRKGLGKLTINVSDSDKFLARYISGPFRHGYSEIRINFKDANVLDKVQETLEMMHGFEMIEQGENHCIIKNIATGMEEEIDELLKRLFMVTINMFKESYEAIHKKQYSRLKNIANLERMNSRLADFCKRLLNLNDYPDPYRSKELYYIFGLFEEFGDDFRDICKLIEKDKKPLNKNVLKIYKQVVDHFAKLYDHYYKTDKSKLVDYKLNRKRLLKDIHNQYSKVGRTDTIVLAYLQTILFRSHHVTEEIQF